MRRTQKAGAGAASSPSDGGGSRGGDETPPWHAHFDSTNLDEFLTVDEAAALLRVNRKTIYDSIRRDELPGVLRLGRAIRIRRRVLLESFTTDHRRNQFMELRALRWSDFDLAAGIIRVRASDVNSIVGAPQDHGA